MCDVGGDKYDEFAKANREKRADRDFVRLCMRMPLEDLRKMIDEGKDNINKALKVLGLMNTDISDLALNQMDKYNYAHEIYMERVLYAQAHPGENP